jgi:hypothetical protein
MVPLHAAVQFTTRGVAEPTAIDADFVDDDTYAGRCALDGEGVGIEIENATLTDCGAFCTGTDACGTGCCAPTFGVVPPPPQPATKAAARTTASLFLMTHLPPSLSRRC